MLVHFCFLIYMFGDNFGSYRFTGFACNYFLLGHYLLRSLFLNTFSVYRLCCFRESKYIYIGIFKVHPSPFFFCWCSFHFLIFFFFYCVLFWLISVAVFYSSPVFSSVMSNLPLIPSSIFFFSGIIVFVSSGFIWMLLHLPCLYLTF